MKIAYLSNSYIPSRNANSVHVMRMCEALAKQSTEVSLYHPGGARQEIQVKDVNQFYGIRHQFARKRLPEFPVRGRAEIYAMMAARIARWRQSDVAYCRDILSCFRTLQAKIPSALELHMPPRPGSKEQRRVKQIINHERFLGLFVITDTLKTEIANGYKVEADSIVVLPDAAHAPPDNLTIELGTPGRLQIGYLGSLLPGKGVELIPKIAELAPQAFFHVVGGNDDQIARKREETQHLNNIKFHGFVPPGVTHRYLNAFDIVLSPNQPSVLVHGNTDIGRYTSPLKIFEYMIAGKAIIASDLAVLKEVLRNGENCLLCHSTDALQWAAAIDKLSASETLRKQLGHNAKVEANNCWTWDSRAQKLLNWLGNR